LGIGEGTYGVLAPSILMDVFEKSKRARVLACFYLAMPVGYALGVKLGGFIAESAPGWDLPLIPEYFRNWRLAFFVVGAPGLLAAIAALFLPEPIRGQSEGFDPEQLLLREKTRPTLADYRDLLVNSSYTYTLFGMAAFTFAFGGLAFWLPEYLERVRELPKHDVDNMVALTGFSAAIVGMAGGGWLADRLLTRFPGALFLVSGSSMLLAVPCIICGLFSTQPASIVVWLFLAQVLMFANTGPNNAVIANVVPPSIRATGYAVSSFFIHFLGDAWSPLIMGAVSDYFGQPSLMHTPFGDLLRTMRFAPVEIQGRPTNLGAGMLVVVPAVLLGGVVLLAGMRHLPREMALMRARLAAELARLNRLQAEIPPARTAPAPAANPTPPKTTHDDIGAGT
jgi:predicted MFS family arabinose efflux permease